jgi:hypothetical protein
LDGCKAHFLCFHWFPNLYAPEDNVNHFRQGPLLQHAADFNFMMPIVSIGLAYGQQWRCRSTMTHCSVAAHSQTPAWRQTGCHRHYGPIVVQVLKPIKKNTRPENLYYVKMTLFSRMLSAAS